VQVISTALFNGYVIGFAEGKIFTGATKALCVPVLNCYSCPGALGACPIGALQAVIGGTKHSVSFYVIGSMMLFGTVFGRLICGFMCPFGLVQDLLYKVPLKKIHISERIDRPARYLKYLVALVLVVVLPTVLTNDFGMASPYFCKFLCPAGTLGGGIPLLVSNESIRATIGLLFGWKFFLLVAILVASILISRPFCKYLCPLGAFYSLFSRFSLFQMRLDQSKCVGCRRCVRVCIMDIDPTKSMGGPECIRCGGCASVCPAKAIASGFEFGAHVGTKPRATTSGHENKEGDVL